MSGNFFGEIDLRGEGELSLGNHQCEILVACYRLSLSPKRSSTHRIYNVTERSNSKVAEGSNYTLLLWTVHNVQEQVQRNQ